MILNSIILTKKEKSSVPDSTLEGAGHRWAWTFIFIVN